MPKDLSDDFATLLTESVFSTQLRAEIWRKDLNSGVDELRASSLIIDKRESVYEEVLDDGIVKSSITLSIHDPIGSLFPYTLDAPTSFLGNRIKLFVDIWEDSYRNGAKYSLKLGEFYIDTNPDGAVPMPRHTIDDEWEHIGGSIKIHAVDTISKVGAEIFVLPLRKISQTASEAIGRITKDYNWASRGITINTDDLDDDDTVQFKDTSSDTNPFGQTYPENVADAIRDVMTQIRKICYTDPNGVLCFRHAGDNDAHDYTPAERLKKQSVKMDFRDVFNAILVEDTDQDQEGNQRAFYKLTTEPLLAYGRFDRIVKKFSVDEIPNEDVAQQKIYDAIAQSGKMTFTTAYLALELSAGDGVMINPRIGELKSVWSTVQELQHDFEAGTTDVTVGFLNSYIADCPTLGQTFEIVAGEFNRKL